jgi:glycine/D-amino acid oxidase-like deaminating enzyme
MPRPILDRRALLQLLAGAAVAGWPRVGRAAGERIVIAGGGILGANLAYRLAKRGAAVTVVERSRPASGATANSFAWINANHGKKPREYFHLNRLGIEAWHMLDAEMPGVLPLRWGGSVEWYGDPARVGAFRDEVRRHQGWGYHTNLIDEAALRALEPKVVPGPVAIAAQSPIEGHVDPVRVTEILLERAGQAGARVVLQAEVTGLDRNNGRLRAVRSTAGDIEADVLLIACGTDTPRVAAMANIHVPLKDSPGILVHTAPQPRLIDRVVLAPVAHMKQKPDGRLVAGTGFGAAASTDTSHEAGARFLTAASQTLPPLATAAVEKVTLGWRPLPADGFPVIGFPPGRRDVYVTVMHSGVTLSPAVALFAAGEILDGVEAEPLAPYRPARFEKESRAR